MEEINLDLEENNLRNLDLDLNSNSGIPNRLNIIKNDTPSSNNGSSSNTPPNLSMSPPNSPSKDSNIGLDLLVNKKKQSTQDNANIFKSETAPPPPPPPSSNTNTSFFNKKPERNIDSKLNIMDLDKSSTNNNTESLDDILSDINLDSQNQSEQGVDNNDIFASLNDTRPNEPEDIPKPKSYEEIQKEKFELLCKLESLESKGIKLTKTFSMQSDFDEMNYEYNRIVKQREALQSVKFQRKMLVAFVTAIEFLNNRFDPFDIKLDGWSESIHENINDYDDVFEELHEKYKSKAQIAPEIKLMLMLGGSGFMFHLTNTMFKSSLPGMGDIMKQNPELMQQFAKAAVNTMGEQDSGLGNLMGDMMNMQQPSSQSRREPPTPPREPSRKPPRKEMNGPPDLDQILNQLSEKNINNINLDSASELSESDIDIKNVEINNVGRRRRNKKENGITLDL